MFKSWKKKPSTKDDQNDTKRFNLLGTKKTRNSESSSRDIRSYSFSSPVNEKSKEVLPQPYAPIRANTYNSDQPIVPTVEVKKENLQQTSMPRENAKSEEVVSLKVEKKTVEITTINDSQTINSAIVESSSNSLKEALLPVDVKNDIDVPSSNIESTTDSNNRNEETVKLKDSNLDEEICSTIQTPEPSISGIDAITHLGGELDQSYLTYDDQDNNGADNELIFRLDNRVQKLQKQV
ncbi:hypothetical protein K7432_011920, partial [Basidiobolus ranarum]